MTSREHIDGGSTLSLPYRGTEHPPSVCSHVDTNSPSVPSPCQIINQNLVVVSQRWLLRDELVESIICPIVVGQPRRGYVHTFLGVLCGRGCRSVWAVRCKVGKPRPATIGSARNVVTLQPFDRFVKNQVSRVPAQSRKFNVNAIYI